MIKQNYKEKEIYGHSGSCLLIGGPPVLLALALRPSDPSHPSVSNEHLSGPFLYFLQLVGSRKAKPEKYSSIGESKLFIKYLCSQVLAN